MAAEEICGVCGETLNDDGSCPICDDEWDDEDDEDIDQFEVYDDDEVG